ncbi:hypothetical protein P4597_14355 [Peribacillus simplex]|nr:hypothetical protein [Peribacillus simplex]
MEISNGFFRNVKRYFAIGEFEQSVTINELVEDLKEKLSGIFKEPDRV